MLSSLSLFTKTQHQVNLLLNKQILRCLSQTISQTLSQHGQSVTKVSRSTIWCLRTNRIIILTIIAVEQTQITIKRCTVNVVCGIKGLLHKITANTEIQSPAVVVSITDYAILDAFFNLCNIYHAILSYRKEYEEQMKEGCCTMLWK